MHPTLPTSCSSGNYTPYRKMGQTFRVGTKEYRAPSAPSPPPHASRSGLIRSCQESRAFRGKRKRPKWAKGAAVACLERVGYEGDFLAAGKENEARANENDKQKTSEQATIFIHNKA